MICSGSVNLIDSCQRSHPKADFSPDGMKYAHEVTELPLGRADVLGADQPGCKRGYNWGGSYKVTGDMSQKKMMSLFNLTPFIICRINNLTHPRACSDRCHISRSPILCCPASGRTWFIE